MILKNIEWEKVLTSQTRLARNIRYAERWAYKTECAMASGSSFDGCIERCGKEAREGDWSLSQENAAIGLLYSCWDRHEAFRAWYLTKHGRDLKEWSELPARNDKIWRPDQADQRLLIPDGNGKWSLN